MSHAQGHNQHHPPMTLAMEPMPETSTLSTDLDPPAAAEAEQRSARVEDKGMDAACKLVQDLLNQISLKDSPPGNEAQPSPSAKGSTKNTTGQRSKATKCAPFGDRHSEMNQMMGSTRNIRPSPLDEMVSISSNDPSDLWMAHNMMRSGNPGEQQLGSVSLAALCTRTLETLGVPVDESPKHVDAFARVEGRSTTPHGKSKNKAGQQGDKQKRWMRKSQGNSPKHRHAKENHTRLEMFGSEYARYLSSTALAPVTKDEKVLSNAQGSGARMRLNRRHPQQTSARVRTIEEATADVASGAITDIVLTYGNDPPPKGYFRISQTSGGHDVHFGKSAKSPVSLFVKKEKSWDRAAQRPCVTALAIVFPHRNEFVPPGFTIAKRHFSIPTEASPGEAGNLNLGGNEPVHLCFRRSREGNPITAIVPLCPARQDFIPQGFTALERSPRNHVANVHPTGFTTFIAYRQRLANLESLRPLPLVLSVGSSGNARRLTSYYCTGATTVQSDVGRFHILDRSTHALLSPSSMSNRIALIVASRRKTYESIASLPYGGQAPLTYSSSSNESPKSATDDPSKALTSSLLMIHGLGTPAGTHGGATDTDHSSNTGHDSASLMLTDDGQSLAPSLITLSPSVASTGLISFAINDDLNSVDTSLTGTTISLGSDPRMTFVAKSEHHFRRCLDVMSFIPTVQPCSTDPRSLGIFQSKVALLAPILTSAYTRHGGSALLAVEGLHELLKNGFFDECLATTSSGRLKAGGGVDTEMNMLDLAIQVVCDVATTGAQEMQLQTCVDFVEDATSMSLSILSPRTTGYILRFNLFVFYFGATTPTSGTNPVWGGRDGVDEYMLTDPRSPTLRYLPGGAPQMAVLCLKEVVTMTIARLVHTMKLEQKSRCDAASSKQEETTPTCEPEAFNSFVDDLLRGVVDDATNRVDLANYTQLAIHQIHRSGGSELFWFDMMHMCGEGLFGDGEMKPSGMERSIDHDANGTNIDTHEITQRSSTMGLFSLCFAMLANLVKISSSRIRKVKSSESTSRDIASKLLGLELIHHFLTCWRKVIAELPSSTEGMRKACDTFVYCIRRLVVPCLVSNTREAMSDSRVNRRILQICGVLWDEETFRSNMKLEIGLMFDHFLNKPLQIGFTFRNSPNQSIGKRRYVMEQQIDAMAEMERWLLNSQDDLSALCINFDNFVPKTTRPQDLSSSIQWNIFQKLCSNVCNVIEYCGEFIGNQIRQSQAMTSVQDDKAEAIEGDVQLLEKSKRLRESGLTLLEHIMSVVLDAAITYCGPAFEALMKDWAEGDGCMDDANISRVLPDDFDGSSTPTMDGGGRLNGKSILQYWDHAITEERQHFRDTIDNASTGDDENDGDDHSANAAKKDEGRDGRGWDVSPMDSSVRRRDYSENLRIAFDLGGTKGIDSCIDYLIACNILTSSPRDIASFLRVNRGEFNASDLGKFLGEGGVDASETERFNLIRFNFIRANSFAAMSVEQALRYLLTNGGFRLPGEAQQIDRILLAFAQCFWEDNLGDMNYCPFQDRDTVLLVSFATIMLNTDLHTVTAKKSSSSSKKSSSRRARKKMTMDEFCNNLRKAEQNEEMPIQYLQDIYTSIENEPIQMIDAGTISDDGADRLPHEHTNSDSSQNLAAADDDLQSPSPCASVMMKNVKTIDALLRGFATQLSPLTTMEEYCATAEVGKINATESISRGCVLKTWHLTYGVINSLLEKAHLDMAVLESCTKLLRLMLCITTCLDMRMQRKAFFGQLARLRTFHNRRQSKAKDASTGDSRFEKERWYKNIERACNRGDDMGKLHALECLRKMLGSFEPVAVDTVGSRELLVSAVARLENAERLLNDPGRRLIREGALMKRANRSGRETSYQFFLFSDVLIYAKPGSSSGSSSKTKYTIHEELPLMQMKVVDWFPPSKKKEAKRAFQVYHPRKKLLVLCSSREERGSWVQSIRDAISREIENKVATEAARLAAAKLH